MMKSYKRKELISEIRRIIAGGSYECKYRGHGRAGNLIEELLGLDGSNLDIADAGKYELKTSLSSSTPITLFHKDPKPRGTKEVRSAVKTLIEEFGWESDYHGQVVKSFRATVYGQWWNSSKTVCLDIIANPDKVQVMHGDTEKAYWDSDSLISAAAAKLRNIMHVRAIEDVDGRISFTDAQLFETFGALKFLSALQDGIVAIDFDARTKPNSNAIRNHGTKFRIKERDIPRIFETITPIKP